MQQDPRQQKTQNRTDTQHAANRQSDPEQSAQRRAAQYRSATPYAPPPRAQASRVPYPPSELRRRQLMLKKRRRRRTLILTAVTLLCLLLLTSLVFAGIWAFRSLTTDTPAADGTDVLSPPDTALAESNAQPSDPETPPPLPPYDAPHKVVGTLITPKYTDNTVTPDAEISCPYAILINAQTGEIVAEKNAEQTIYPASMTKLMTVLVAYENIPDLNAAFRMTNEIIDPLYLDGLSLAGFSGGEDVVLRDMLYGSALPSGAEASIGLAIAACGSEKAFVARMNERAASLGMTGTHYENCTGAHHADHVSTLSDIAILLSYMMQNETLAEILGTYQHTTTPTDKHPEGLLMTSTVFSRMEGSESGVCTVVGGKTGYTAEAGQCLATYAVHHTDKTPYVCVTAGGDTKWRPVYDSIYLYQYHTGTKAAADMQ